MSEAFILCSKRVRRVTRLLTFFVPKPGTGTSKGTARTSRPPVQVPFRPSSPFVASPNSLTSTELSNRGISQGFW